MAQERETEHRRIVVDTPGGRREEIHSEARQYPERSGGVSGAALAAIVVGVVALAAIIILFVMNQQQSALNENATAQQQQQQPPQTIIQQPAQQPPVIVQQPAPVSGTTTTTSGPDDSSIQTAIDKKLSDDQTLSSLGITATVMNGKVTLLGVVKSQAEKTQVERAVRQIKGVKSIDNQISVSS
jgi:osmotically-inducible protein OsmY